MVDLITAKERLKRFGESPKPTIYGGCQCGVVFLTRSDYEQRTGYMGYQKDSLGPALELRECGSCGTTLARAI